VRLVESVLAPAELRELEPVGQAEGPALSIYCSSTVMLVEIVFVLGLKRPVLFLLRAWRSVPRAPAPRDRTQSIYANARCLGQVNAYNKNIGNV
jgi:hypothetical protein